MSEPLTAPSRVTYSFQPIMRLETVTILCESAKCCRGLSAAQREDALRGSSDPMLVAHEVTKALVYQTHTWMGGTRYRCTVCGNSRLFG